MPTPVSTARQCLTDEAARALDDAVAVARRRSHAQTTSLHAVSSLLSMPSSLLREVCVARARTGSAYNPRLQFRALELCVGVSLDRLPSSKSPETENEPPVSNSLMAAIKRSQANQRRHPEMYHLQQIHNTNQTTSILKVELKYFILSILDDPIVSRVFEEAGFRSCDIKMAVIHPPVTQSSPRFTRFPPLFLCNLTDSDPNRTGFGYPQFHDPAENWKRIGEVLGRRENRNPLLIGVSANDAQKSFIDAVKTRGSEFLPAEISRLSVISIEKEFSELKMIDEDEAGSKISEVGRTIEQQCSNSSRLLVSLGELKVMISDSDDSGASLHRFVSKLADLLRIHEGKLWMIAYVSSNETYLKVLDRFPTIQKDWDLHLLPITSSKPTSQGVYPKSSLMGSFVPFGGFFSTPSDFKTPFSGINQSTPCCHLCNEKYEQEAAAFIKLGSKFSAADQEGGFKARDDRIALDSQISALREKWNGICIRLHQTPALPKLNFRPANLYASESIQSASHRDPDSLKSQTADESQSLSSVVHMSASENFQAKHKSAMPFVSVSDNANFQSKLSVDIRSSHSREALSGVYVSKPPANMCSIESPAMSSSVPSVSTDLGLGTLYASTSYGKNTYTPRSLNERAFESNLVKPLPLPLHSFPSTGPMPGDNRFNIADLKGVREFLCRKVSWQSEAVNSISEIVCRGRAGYGRSHGSLCSPKGVWVLFLGPDRIGKKKIASAIAEIIFDSKKSLISVDFGEQDSYGDKFRGKTAVDYVTGELSRKPHSVVFMENVDKAELPDQISLSSAVSTGKLRDSQGREISTSNMIFLMTSDNNNANVVIEKKTIKFSEEKVLGAKSWKMQMTVLKVADDARTGLNKRKLKDTRNKELLRSPKAPRSFLDLNLPVEDPEENANAAEFETDTLSENTEAWLKDFHEKVMDKVVFKPFDFDGIAQKIEKEIFAQFHRYFGIESQLEIDGDVILQILRATWSSDEDSSIQDWVKNVVGASFAEAKQKYGSDAPQSTVKLVSCTGFPVEETAGGIDLPAKILI